MQMREVSITNHENLELHEFCSMFPEMGEKDFDSLLESMKHNGFLSTDPIVLIWQDDDDEEMLEGGDWLILDGQNRHLAASQAKVTPIFVQYKGDDPLGFVMARNFDRRHLNTGQKAAIAVQIAEMGKGIKQKDAAKQAGVGEASLRRFKFIQERDPKLAEKVASGEIPMEKARAQVKKIGDMERAMHENQEEVEPEQTEGYKLGDKKRAKIAKLTKVEVTIHAKFQVMYDPDKQEYPDQLAKAIAALEKGGLAEVEVINEGDE